MAAWQAFYPVPPCADDVPDVVDVSVGGVHMIYPSSLLVVSPGLEENPRGQARASPSCGYNYGLQSGWRSVTTVNRLSKRVHSDLVYTGATERRYVILTCEAFTT